MALINCNFYSNYLSYDTQINIILPEARGTASFDESRPHKFQTLYLLHGKGDDCNAWIRNTSIERYANDHCVAVVLPTGEDSFYVDSISGKLYGKYISEELPELLNRWFPLSSKPEDTYIAGLSMGGYGAANIGFSHPENFAGIGLFSAAFYPHKLYGIFDNDIGNSIIEENLNRVFGTDALQDNHNIEKIINEKLLSNAVFPPIYQYIGKQDFIYDNNVMFQQFAKKSGLTVHYEEWDGIHDWKFWDTAVQKFLDSVGLKNQPVYS